MTILILDATSLVPSVPPKVRKENALHVLGPGGQKKKQLVHGNRTAWGI